MRIVFMGTPEFSLNVLEGLIENYNVVGVVSQPDKKVGRNQEIKETPTKLLAMKHNILVLQPEKIKEDYQSILDLKPDLIVTCAYGQIIPKAILDYPKHGCINVHASLLPKLRGGAPIHKAIIDGHEETGITIMYMVEKMDAGDIISQKRTKIEDDDTLETLHDRLSIMGKELLLETIKDVEKMNSKRIKQDEEEVTYAYNIKREEEHIDFNKSSQEIYNLIRGLNPFPSANVLLLDQEMKVYESKIQNQKYNNAKNGEIVDINKEGIIVKTNDGSILLTKIKPFGKKTMDATSYVNGIGKDKLIGKVFK